MPNVNFIAVLVAAAASMVVGFVWYGPLFGKPWMKLMGFKGDFKPKMDAKMQKTYLISFVGSLITAYVLSVVIGFMGRGTVVDGMMAGFWSWVGFVAPIQMLDVLFGGKNWNLYYINAGFQLVSLLVMGAVITQIG